MVEPFIPYCRPDTGERESIACGDAIRAGWLTTGPMVNRFERAFESASGIPNAVALNSCTAGLHLALLALGVGPGDEVVMPSLTFVAGAQCALEVGAKPVFCDVEPDTLAASIRTIAPAITPRTRAIIAMPYAGRPMGMRDLCEFARSLRISVIEDAAHASGMLDAGEWPGTHSDCAAFSFYATKNIASGEGGMLLARDRDLADRVRRLSLHGMSRDAWKRYTDRGNWRYDVVEPGFKYNMPDLAASIGLVQLERLPEMQAARHAIASRYLKELSGEPGVSFQRAPDAEGDVHSWCMFAMIVDERVARIGRDELIETLRSLGIGTSVHYIPTHTFSGYRSLPHGPLDATDELAGRIVSLPLYPSMTSLEVERVIAGVKTALRTPVAAG